MFTGRALAVFWAFSPLLLGQPAKTTIQDTLFKADGAPFNGTAIVTWQTFQAGDTSAIGMQSLTAPIVNGALYVQLVPNTTATPVNFYTVRYNSDGREQFTETWAVPPSVTSLRISAVRVLAGAATGGTGSGGPTGQTPILETDVIGLAADLTVRPVKGPGYAASRAAVINDAGELEGIAGTSDDCVHVDGSSSPCSTVVSTQIATFVDLDIPAGNIDGVNDSFTLANAPTPSSSLSLFRNGVFQLTGTDFALAGNVIQFAPGAQPQPGDNLTAMYRLGGSAGLTAAGALTTSGTVSGNLTISVIDSAFLRRGHKTMVLGDSQTGASAPGDSFPTVPANWFGMAAVESRSRIRYWGNAGIAGDSTAAMLARLTADVIANDPDKVFIEAGYTDIHAGVSVASVISNVNTIVNRLKAAKILPLLCTLPPDASSSQTALAIVQLNFQLRQIADAQGIPLVDFYSILADPRTGRYRQGFSTDNIHPSLQASRAMAKAAIDAVGTAYDGTSPWLPVSDADGINLLADPLFASVPSAWAQTVVSGGVAAVLTAVNGGMTIQKSDAASVNTLSGQAIASGFTPGDRMAFTGVISSTGAEAGNLLFDVSLQFNPGTATMYPIYHWSVDIQAGQWYVEFMVPGGATSVTPVIQLNGGTGSVTIGQIGLVNLSAM